MSYHDQLLPKHMHETQKRMQNYYQPYYICDIFVHLNLIIYAYDIWSHPGRPTYTTRPRPLLATFILQIHIKALQWSWQIL